MSDKSDPRNVCSIKGSRLSPIVIASLAFSKQCVIAVEVTKLVWAFFKCGMPSFKRPSMYNIHAY